MILSIACKKEKDEKKSGGKDILSFVFKAADNPALLADLSTTIRNDTIFWSLTSDTMTKVLVPTITISAGATISPVSNEVVDLSEGLTYTVTAPDGSVKKYVTSLKLVAAPTLAGLKINGATLSYDSAARTYYFPVSMGTTLSEIKAQFDTTQAAKVLFDGTLTSYNTAAGVSMVTNQILTVRPATAEGLPGDPYSLVITGMPIVQLSTFNTINETDYVGGAITVTDPDSAAHGSSFFVSSNITIKYRGATSLGYPKKQFAVKLQDASGSSQDIPMLGLREDNNWILDAMYADQARMRNRLCTDIWNSYNNVPYIADEPDAHNGTRGYFVEVFMNNSYLGLFCMTEKLDRKQLKAKKKGGFVYKADTWTTATLFSGVGDTPYDNSLEDWNGWESSYPDAGDDVAMDWSYIYNLVNFVSTSSDEDFVANVSANLNLANMADYLILLNVIAGDDNQGKNTFMSVYNVNKSTQFFYSPWDMDATFGRDYTATLSENASTLYGVSGGNVENNIYVRLLTLNPSSFRETVKARWNELKSSQLSKATINARIEAYRDLIINTKAMDREMAMWGSLDIASETAYMESWYSNRFDFLDTYFNNL
jgi:hypothetical protein